MYELCKALRTPETGRCTNTIIIIIIKGETGRSRPREGEGETVKDRQRDRDMQTERRGGKRQKVRDRGTQRDHQTYHVTGHDIERGKQVIKQGPRAVQAVFHITSGDALHCHLSRFGVETWLAFGIFTGKRTRVELVHVFSSS